jgi:uncharacterized protein (TIRG00374 family)
LISAATSTNDRGLVTSESARDAAHAAPHDSVPPTAREPRGWFRRHLGKTIGSLVIAAAFIIILRKGGLPLTPQPSALARMSWGWVALHTLLMIAVLVVRAARWRHLLRPLDPDVSLRRVLAASWLGFTAILLLPLRAGEFVRPWLARDGKRISMSAALGTIGAERVIDGLFVTGLLAATLTVVPRLSPLPDHIGQLHVSVAAIPAAAYVALAVFVAAFGAMALFYFARAFARRLVFRTVGLVSEKLAERLANIVEGVADGLHFLVGPRYALPFLAETTIYWMLNATSMWVLGIACGMPMTFGHACATMGVLAVGILVPAGPGLFGAFQAATYGALAMYFGESMVLDHGSAYVFLLYAVQFVLQLVTAGIGMAMEPSLLRSTEP